jgi:hypothetical protein
MRPASRAGGRRVWPWILGLVAIVAITWSTMARLSREGRDARYARAKADSSKRADSLAALAKAQADSVSSAALVGGMVDTSKLAEQAKKDSLANAQRALTNAVTNGIRGYTSAIQRGDIAAARAAFPRVDEAELARWQSALDKNDIRIRVDAPRSVQLSEGGVVADADVTLVVEYIDRTTKSPVSTNRLPRHATLTKQKQKWQLDALKPR